MRILAVKPLQVIEDVPLVVGKPTVLKITLQANAATSVTLQTIFGGIAKSATVRLNRGQNTVYVPVDPPGGAGLVGASVALPGGAPVEATATAVALRKDRLRLLYLTVDWTEADRAADYRGQVQRFAETSSDFFRATYPLPDGNLTYQVAPSPFLLTPEQRAIGDAQGNLNWNVLVPTYAAIAVTGRQVLPDADLVIGVLPPGWFGRNLHSPRVVGLEVHAVRATAAVQAGADHATTAHEVGHLFGRTDEYDLNAKPPRVGNRIDAPGYWITRGQAIQPGTNPVYYSFMGAQDASSQSWVDRATYLAILQTLQSGGP